MPTHGSAATERKVRRLETADGEPVRSLETLLADLQTLTQNEVRIQGTEVTFHSYTRPTPLQQKTFDLLGVTHRLSPCNRTTSLRKNDGSERNIDGFLQR